MAHPDSTLRWSLAGTDPQGSLLEGDVDPTRELREVEYLHVKARSIISEVPAASRMPFRYTINPYRGCSHACTYCFARPTHEYLGLNGGDDFERRIVVKVNAVERLAAELARPSWTGEHIAMGTNTDPYQQCEGRYRLTRGIVETLGRARNPFSILTKSTMIQRDLDVLVAAAERTDVRVNFSIGTLDEEVWRISEPGTPPPWRRVEALARLTEAGLPCGVLVAPILPGLSDGEEQLSQVVPRLRRGGRGLDLEHRPPPAPRRARAVHAVAPARAARSGRALRRALRRPQRLPRARRAEEARRPRAGARRAARRVRAQPAAVARVRAGRRTAPEAGRDLHAAAPRRLTERR